MRATIELTASDMALAEVVGMARRTRSKGFKSDLHHDKNQGVAGEVRGVAGELAVARFMDAPWSGGVDTFKGADVARTIQVRTSAYDDAHLIVRGNDDRDHAVVLVIDARPQWIIAGWVTVRRAQQPEFWRCEGDRPATWWVPQSRLRCPHELRALWRTATIESWARENRGDMP